MKDWKGNSKATYVTLGASNHTNAERQEHDYYATDPVAIDALARIGFFDGTPNVWEPACGGGHLSKRMEELGISVVSTDLYKNGYGEPGVDFLKTTNLLAPVVVTNPPYKFAQEFVQHAIDLGAWKVAMFLKLTFLEGQARRALFDKYPPSTVGVFTQRIQCAMNGDPTMFAKSSAACYAWFIWDKSTWGNEQRPEIVWCDRKPLTSDELTTIKNLL